VATAPADYYPLQDLLYRTTALADAAGSVAEAYDTDAYGRTLIFNASGTDAQWFTDDDTTTGEPTCEFIFTGRRYDPETQLYFYRARYYNPTLGRFISRDPIGYQDGMGLYNYVNCKPDIGLDPRGLRSIVDHQFGLFRYSISTNCNNNNDPCKSEGSISITGSVTVDTKIVTLENSISVERHYGWSSESEQECFSDFTIIDSGSRIRLGLSDLQAVISWQPHASIGILTWEHSKDSSFVLETKLVYELGPYGTSFLSTFTLSTSMAYSIEEKTWDPKCCKCRVVKTAIESSASTSFNAPLTTAAVAVGGVYVVKSLAASTAAAMPAVERILNDYRVCGFDH
jgi:RHS repeat-associated protein